MLGAEASKRWLKADDDPTSQIDLCICLFVRCWTLQMMVLTLRLLSASALRRRERLSRAENGLNGFSTSSTSTRATSNLVTPSSPRPRNVVSAVHLAPKASNNKLILQMGHLLPNEEGNQKKLIPSVAPSPRQSATPRHHPDGVQRLPP